MTAGTKLTLRILVLFALGVAGFRQLAAWSAPDHDEAAWLIGLLLTTFGVVAVAYAMQLLVLAVALVRALLRVFQDRKPLVINARGRDPLDLVGRLVFVAGFMALSAVVGAGAGWSDGGRGVLASAAAFAAFGAMLALLVPADVMFATVENTGGTVTAEQRADYEAARQAGEPTILFVDRVVKGLREKLFERQGTP
jgi:hypothetical protein